MPRLICCPSCSTFVLPDEPACPFCGATSRRLGRRMGVVALGFALGGCPAESAPDDEEAEVSAEPLYGVATTGDTLDTDGATSSPATSSTTTDASESSAPGSSSDASSSGGETDTDTGSTSLEPDYGVPTTTG